MNWHINLIWKFVGLTVLTLSLGSCQTTPAPSDRLDADQIKSLGNSVFEVAILKQEKKDVVYSESLPRELLPIHLRNSKYLPVGTAFAISSNRFVTAAHVLNVEKYKTDAKVFVRDKTGKAFEIDRIYRYSTYRDLAVFSLKTPISSVKALNLQKKSNVGDVVYTVGNAYGEGISFRDGQIASYTPEPDKGAWQYLRFTAAASPGNSGGPLLNARGEVLGVVTMRNENENLNFAVPINEMRSLSRRKAEFYNPKAAIDTALGTKDLTWKTTLKLPSSLASLSKRAQQARQKFWMGSWWQIFNETNGTRFPSDPEARLWLMRQEFSSVLSFVSRANGQPYALESREGRVARRSNGDQIRFVIESDRLTSFNLVPSSTKLMNQYIKSPEKILDGVIELQGWERPFAGRRIGVISLGRPNETGRFVDRYGRPWLKATWRTEFDFTTRTLNCLTMPKGFACMLLQFETENENMAFQERFERYDSTEIVLSYSGTVTDWADYRAVNPRYVPGLVRNALVARRGQAISLRFPGFSTTVTDGKVSDSSWIFVGVGPDPDNINNLSIQGFKFTHAQGSSRETSQEIFTAHRPQYRESRQVSGLWGSFLQGLELMKPPLNLKVYRSLVDANGRSVNTRQPERYPKVYEVQCTSLTLAPDATCKAFIKSSNFRKLGH